MKIDMTNPYNNVLLRVWVNKFFPVNILTSMFSSSFVVPLLYSVCSYIIPDELMYMEDIIYQIMYFQKTVDTENFTFLNPY